MVEGRRSARLQSARPVKKRDPAADPMPVYRSAMGQVVISGPLRTLVCVFGCVHTELGSPPIGSDDILYFEQFVRSA